MQESHRSIVSLKLDMKYIDWRIRSHPFLKYQEYQVVSNSVLKAYAFVTLSDGNISISDIGSESEYACQLILSQIIKDYSRT